MTTTNSNTKLYIALEGVICAGKTSTLKWLRTLFERDNINATVIEEPVKRFSKKDGFDPLRECYADPLKSGVAAQLHILNESFDHYSSELSEARKQGKDIIISERSILSPFVFTHAYFLSDFYSAFTKDYIHQQWTNKMKGKYEEMNVRPDLIIFLSPNTEDVEERIKKDLHRSEEEREFLGTTSKTNLNFTAALHFAYLKCLSSFNLPVVTISVPRNASEEDVASKVYSAISKKMCAEVTPTSLDAAP